MRGMRWCAWEGLAVHLISIQIPPPHYRHCPCVNDACNNTKGVNTMGGIFCNKGKQGQGKEKRQKMTPSPFVFSSRSPPSFLSKVPILKITFVAFLPSTDGILLAWHPPATNAPPPTNRHVHCPLVGEMDMRLVEARMLVQRCCPTTVPFPLDSDS